MRADQTALDARPSAAARRSAPCGCKGWQPSSSAERRPGPARSPGQHHDVALGLDALGLAVHPVDAGDGVVDDLALERGHRPSSTPAHPRRSLGSGLARQLDQASRAAPRCPPMSSISRLRSPVWRMHRQPGELLQRVEHLPASADEVDQGPCPRWRRPPGRPRRPCRCRRRGRRCRASPRDSRLRPRPPARADDRSGASPARSGVSCTASARLRRSACAVPAGVGSRRHGCSSC